MVSVCFRFDDASARSDHSLEQKVFAIFAQLGVPLCVAAIPFLRTADGETVQLSARNAGHLLDAARAKVIDIAQHGHSHVHHGNDPRGRRSEFAGASAAHQARMIAEGLDHLASVFNERSRGFVPPWNTYDGSTTHALAEAGFAYLSAGWEVAGCKVHRSGALPVVAATCTLNTVRSAIERAHRFHALEPVFVVVIHSDDFEEYRRPPRPDELHPFTNLGKLKSLLTWIVAQPCVRTDAIWRIAASVRNGMDLRSSVELTLPYRVKALLPPMLVRSATWKTLPGTLWGAYRSRNDFDALAPSGTSPGD